MGDTNKLYGAILLGVFVLGITNPIQAQTWRSLNGPSESDISDIVIKNDTIYATSSETGGFFKRNVNSSQWFYASVSEGEGPFRKEIASPLSINVDDQGNYYIGGVGVVSIGDQQTYNHFFVSNNYGSSWSEFRNGIESTHTIEDIFITEGGNLLLGSAGGIFSLNHEEETFERVENTSLSYSFFHHKDTLITGTIEGIEYSVNEGETWIKTGPDTLQVFSISHFKENYLFGTDQGIYRTKVLGNDWTLIEDFSPKKNKCPVLISRCNYSRHGFRNSFNLCQQLGGKPHFSIT